MSDAPVKPPVVLQVLPSLRSGGVERGTIEIARAIAAHGWTSLVASGGGPMQESLASVGATHIVLPLYSRNPVTMWLNARRLRKIIKQYGVDIVHARSRAPAWSAWWAIQKTECRFVTTFHGFYGLQNDFKRKYNAIMTRGDRVIAISKFIAAHIANIYAADMNKVRVIHRGVDLKLFHSGHVSPQRKEELVAAWQLPPDRPVILFPGRFTRWKGQDVFIKALQQLPHRHFYAVLLGDDKGHAGYRHEIERLIKQCGLSGHARIAPHTPYMTEAYSLAALVVATSLEPEAFGRVPVEAQAMECPVIAANHGGARETVQPNVTGWLVPPGDVHGLAAVLNHALSMDKAELRWMGEQAALRAQNFSLEAMCDKTLKVYEELLAKRQ